jgi:hypothetical protein
LVFESAHFLPLFLLKFTSDFDCDSAIRNKNI